MQERKIKYSDELKPYSIESRALLEYGETECFVFAGYILPTGQMLNFSYEGRQRDEDHRSISQFFNCKVKDSGSGTEYMHKFMRRGNIRVMCSTRGDYCEFQFIKTPTKEQIDAIKKAAKEYSCFGIERVNKNGISMRYFRGWGDFNYGYIYY